MLSRLLPLLPLLLPAVPAIAPLAAQGLPMPQAEHQQLARDVGTWDAAIETVGMDGKLHASRGTCVKTLGPGGFWVLDDFRGEMNGVQFTGHGALGYDPQKKAYVQSWVSMTPMLMVSTGAFDATGKVLTMTGDGPGMDGTTIPMKNVTTWIDADTMQLEVFVVLPDGRQTKTMTITYTRRAGPKAESAGAKKQ